MNTNQSKRPSDAVIEAARDLAKRLPSGPAESVYHACIELRRLRKAFAELDRQRAETCTARDDTPSKSRTKRIAIQRSEEGGGELDAAKPAQWHESLRSYMDAWCKIVEALDDIRPAWAESDGESVADCACRTIRELAAQAPERRAVTDEDIQRAAAAIALVANPHVVSPAACIEFATRALESLAGVPAAQPAPDDVALADTQRAIIEAAEARGYARAKAEGEADARDVVRLAFCIELGTVPEERPDQPKERRWSLTLYPNGWQVLVVHGSTYVECIDAAIEAAKPQRAAQQRKGG